MDGYGFSYHILHRKILLKVIQDLKDLVKIYGIKGIPRDIKYRTPGQGREL